MLEQYRAEHANHDGFDWGEETLVIDRPTIVARQWWQYGRYVDPRRLLSALVRLQAADQHATWEHALWQTCAGRPGPELALAAVADSSVRIEAGPPIATLPGQLRAVAVLVRSQLDWDTEVDVNDERQVLAAGATTLIRWRASLERPQLVLRHGGEVAAATIVRRAQRGCLQVRALQTTRWSVIDPDGTPWLPAGVPAKSDVHGRVFFHARSAELEVPAGPLSVTAWRGLEYGSASSAVDVKPEGKATLELNPSRHDPEHTGWFGADLHVHMNYSGDIVVDPATAQRMQDGEGLALMNLVAANFSGDRIYDRELLEAYAGTDLPGASSTRRARMGVEYRNDLLGHIHAFGVRQAPSRFQSGHRRSSHPEDWPPNATACRELRSLGGLVGYTHPVQAPPDDLDAPFTVDRSTEARELVADAALGLVDTVDLLGPCSFDGTVALYYRLLNCGWRLTATAGTDVFLSFERMGTFSNPPGWARVYANLRDEEFSADAWQAAARAGRTMVTNGPWLEIDVNGHGPGEVTQLTPGQPAIVHVRCTGVGADRVDLVGPDGVIASSPAKGGHAELRVTVHVDGPGWLAAVGRGEPHPDVLDLHPAAHTTPVYVEVEGRSVARTADASWCLTWLDRVDALARDRGSFRDGEQLDDLIAVLDAARAVYRDVACSPSPPFRSTAEVTDVS
jgi:hypothetical protein